MSLCRYMLMLKDSRFAMREFLRPRTDAELFDEIQENEPHLAEHEIAERVERLRPLPRRKARRHPRRRHE